MWSIGMQHVVHGPIVLLLLLYIPDFDIVKYRSSSRNATFYTNDTYVRMYVSTYKEFYFCET